MKHRPPKPSFVTCETEYGAAYGWRIYGDNENSKLIEYLNENTMVCGETQDTIVYAAF